MDILECTHVFTQVNDLNFNFILLIKTPEIDILSASFGNVALTKTTILKAN